MFEAIFNIEGQEIRVPATITVDGDEFFIALEEPMMFQGEEIPADEEIPGELLEAMVNFGEAEAIAAEIQYEAACDWTLAQQELEDFEGCGWE